MVCGVREDLTLFCGRVDDIVSYTSYIRTPDGFGSVVFIPEEELVFKISFWSK